MLPVIRRIPANCHFQVSQSAMSWALKRSFGVNQTGFAKFGNNGNLKPRHIWDDLQYVFSCFFYTFPSSFFSRIWRYLGNVKTTSGDWILRESAFFWGGCIFYKQTRNFMKTCEDSLSLRASCVCLEIWLLGSQLRC